MRKIISLLVFTTSVAMAAPAPLGKIFIAKDEFTGETVTNPRPYEIQEESLNFGKLSINPRKIEQKDKTAAYDFRVSFRIEGREPLSIKQGESLILLVDGEPYRF